MKIKRTVIIFSILLMMSITLAVAVYVKDMPTGWSHDAVNSAVENELLKVDDGYVRAMELLTRAEMAQGMNNLFGNTKKSDISMYTDVLKEKWYYDDMSKAVAMGLFKGYGNGLLKPEENITREELLTALYNILQLEEGDLKYIEKFNDKQMISDWARPIIARMAQENYITGNLVGNVKPLTAITREEFAQIMANIFSGYYNQAGTYENKQERNIVISVADVILKNSYIEGDLIIAEGVDGGKVILDEVTIDGRILIRGKVKLEIKKKSEVRNDIIVNKFAEGSKISGEGKIENVLSNANNVTVTVDEAKVTAAYNTFGVKAGNKEVKAGASKTVNIVKSSSKSGSSSSVCQHNWQITINATCLDKGKKECTVCGSKKDIIELGHNWAETPAACEVDGFATCLRCNEIEKRSEKLGHNWVQIESLIEDSDSKICSRCSIGIYYVTDYGAIGDGVVNDTLAINKLIENVSDGDTVYFPTGNYLVSATDEYNAIRIEQKSNVVLHMADDATIKYAPTDKGRYHTIRIWKSEGIKVIGGNIIGEVDTHNYEYTDEGAIRNTHGYGILLSASKNILVEGVKISKFYGDGIVNGSDNVVIKDCVIYDSLRNGITSVCGENIKIIGCEIYNITGTAPMAGIDIECEYAGRSNSNVLIEDCNIYNCGRLSVAISSTADNVIIKNSNLQNVLHTDPTVSNMKVSNCNISGFNANANGLEVNNCNLGSVGLNKSSVKCTFIDCDFSPNSDSQNALCIATGANGATGKFINCTFNAPEVQNRTFYTIWCNDKGNLEFKNCKIDTRNRVGGKGIHGNIGNASFNECTFVNTNNEVPGFFLQIDADSVSIINSVFDASALTSYRDNKLIRLYSINIKVENCEIKTANNNTYKPAVYAFACDASNVTGEVYYINNKMHAWKEIGLLPSNAQVLVVEGNEFKK